MIVKDLKIFSQNVQKNNFIINTILKVNHNFNVIFIQEQLLGPFPALRTVKAFL